MTKQQAVDFWSRTKWVWAAIVFLGAVWGSGFTASRKVDAMSRLPDAVQDHETRLQSLERRDTLLRHDIDEIKCHVKVLTAVPGYTMQNCILGERGPR